VAGKPISSPRANIGYKSTADILGSDGASLGINDIDVKKKHAPVQSMA